MRCGLCGKPSTVLAPILTKGPRGFRTYQACESCRRGVGLQVDLTRVRIRRRRGHDKASSHETTSD